jgi:hypothetical protein
VPADPGVVGFETFSLTIVHLLTLPCGSWCNGLLCKY